MTTAYWCVLIIIVMPYMWGGMARFPGFTLKNNLIPRVVSESFTGVKQRVYWAHLNSLEVVAPFSAAVIIAHLVNVQQVSIDSIALTFVVLRVAHGLAYIANLGLIRTIVFVSGLTCIISLFLITT